MDYTVSNNAKLFDEVLEILDRHRGEPGVTEAFDNLRAAKTNYVNRSIDHMITCLVLTIHYLIVNPANTQLQNDLRTVIDRFVREVFEMGSKLSRIALEYERSGGNC